MRKALSQLVHALMLVISLSVIILAGWAWHRSLQYADLIYRLEPTAKGNVMRGVGSYRGAMMLGSIVDTTFITSGTGIRHDAYVIRGRGGPSILSPRPLYKVSGLGFGFSRGELAVNLPLASFLVPPRTYQVIYVPYYFIMLMAAAPLIKFGWRIKRKRAGHSSH